MKEVKEEISPTELLFLIHPNECNGLDLLKLTVLNLTLAGYIELFGEVRLITRKKTRNIEQLFFMIKKSELKSKTTEYESILLDNTSKQNNILQNHIRNLDKALDGIEVFKYYVFKELQKKEYVKSSLTFFGLLKPKYKLTEKGDIALKNSIHKIEDGHFVYKLISTDKNTRIKQMKEVKDSIPDKHLTLINIRKKDWQGANKRSGLDPRGFLPR